MAQKSEKKTLFCRETLQWHSRASWRLYRVEWKMQKCFQVPRRWASHSCQRSTKSFAIELLSVYALLSGSFHNIRAGKIVYFKFRMFLWKYLESLHFTIIVLKFWRSVNLLLFQNALVYQVWMEGAKESKDLKAWNYLFSCGNYWTTVVTRALKGSWHSNFPSSTPHVCSWFVCTRVAWLSLNDVCVSGHDLAVQSAKLHLHPRGLLPPTLLPAPQPLLCPAGQGHQAAVRRHCGLPPGEQQHQQCGSQRQKTEGGKWMIKQ